jgi:hypothetical protein
MTIELVPKEDCIGRVRRSNRIQRRFNEIKTNISKDTKDKESHTLELVPEKDTSNKNKTWARKKTPHEIGSAIRMGIIDIPEDDKRRICKHYDKLTNSCLEYKVIRCDSCKKNRKIRDRFTKRQYDEIY